ncbi:MAG: hypothetical protein MSA53_01800 [Bacteroidales bacterium]|nr:hypothetical protein [Bacteroidales bacterium]
MELKDPQKGQEILSEIKELVSSISKELALIETKMSEYQSLYESDEDRIESLDLEDDYFLNITTAISSPATIERPQPEPEPEPEPVAEQQLEPEPAVEPIAVPEPEPVAEPAAEPEPIAEPTAEPAAEPEPVAEPTAEPEPKQKPKPRPQPEAEQSTAIVDKLAAKQRWRTDMPGSPVKDIRSAIALNDRVLFINTLFDKDPVRFQADLTAINGMDTLAQAIDYFQEHHPEWNFDSDTVYRFMMAVRRRVK